MKLYMQENQIIHAFRTILLPTALTEEDMAPCSRPFQKPKNAGEEMKLIENTTPNSARVVKK